MTTPLFLAPIEALPNLDPAAFEHTTPRAQPGVGGSTAFGEMVTRGLEQVNSQLLDSQMALQQAAAGGTENLHQLMIRLEEARLSFQLMLQVRNRVLESYQELMRTQV